MTTQSNINSYYEELIAHTAEVMKMGVKDDGEDEQDAFAYALDNALMYYADQAYIIAHALTNGLIEWGKPMGWEEWDKVREDLSQDIWAEYHEITKED